MRQFLERAGVNAIGELHRPDRAIPLGVDALFDGQRHPVQGNTCDLGLVFALTLPICLHLSGKQSLEHHLLFRRQCRFAAIGHEGAIIGQRLRIGDSLLLFRDIRGAFRAAA